MQNRDYPFNMRAIFCFLFMVPWLAFSQTTNIIAASYKNGQPKEIHLYLEENNKIALVKKSYYRSNGQKSMVQHYKNKLKNGRFVEWRKDGSRIEEGVYENGDKHGHWIFWSEKGRKVKEGKYVHGLKEGVWTKYTHIGKVLWKKRYENGIEVD